MVSFRLGEKRSVDAAGNAASGHKMFIAARSDFPGSKVRAAKSEVLKHEPPPIFTPPIAALNMKTIR